MRGGKFSTCFALLLMGILQEIHCVGPVGDLKINKVFMSVVPFK